MPTGKELKGQWFVRHADGTEHKITGLEYYTFDEQEGIVFSCGYERVTHCKDCVFFTPGRNNSCFRWKAPITENDYCSRARKRGSE